MVFQHTLLKYKTLSLLLVGFFVNTIIKAQLAVTSGNTPQYYAEQLVGSGVTISNVTFSGETRQLGEFSNGNTTNLGMDQGIVLSTGSVDSIFGPAAKFLGDNGLSNEIISNDSDLIKISGAGNGVDIKDAIILEFDFIPEGSVVKFDFIFASEEYPEWVGGINDAFGFFLSGPGISGSFSNNAQNIALVPGTSLPVSINNINNGGSTDFNDCSDPLNGPCVN